MSLDTNRVTDEIQIELISGPEVVLVRPVRYLPRTRLLHHALPNTEWTLCGRSRVGAVASEDELGREVGGVKTSLCTRCRARVELLSRGKRIGRN